MHTHCVCQDHLITQKSPQEEGFGHICLFTFSMVGFRLSIVGPFGDPLWYLYCHIKLTHLDSTVNNIYFDYSLNFGPLSTTKKWECMLFNFGKMCVDRNIASSYMHLTKLAFTMQLGIYSEREIYKLT